MEERWWGLRGGKVMYTTYMKNKRGEVQHLKMMVRCSKSCIILVYFFWQMDSSNLYTNRFTHNSIWHD
jgi:hypothetical protein